MRQPEESAQRLTENYLKIVRQVAAVADEKPGAQQPSEQLVAAVLADSNALADSLGLARPTNLMQVRLLLDAAR